MCADKLLNSVKLPRACEIALALQNLNEIIDQQPKLVAAWLRVLDAKEWDAVEQERDFAVEGASPDVAMESEGFD